MPTVIQVLGQQVTVHWVFTTTIPLGFRLAVQSKLNLNNTLLGMTFTSVNHNNMFCDYLQNVTVDQTVNAVFFMASRSVNAT